MSVKVEKTENKNELKLEFTVDAKIFEEGIKKVYSKNAHYISVPGFRKGKAPMNIVEKYYGNEVFYEDAFNEVVPEIYEKAIKDEKIDVVSRPSIDVKQMEKGKDLIFTAVVQTKPDVELGKYKGLELEKNEYKVTDHDVEHELMHMAEHNARMITVDDRPAEMGDTTVIDFDGSVDGVPFEGGKAEKYDLVLGSGAFIPGFEDQVVGMKVGENKDVNVSFPKEYFSKDLAGKAAVFKVVLHEIKKKELPEIDDEFAKDVSEFDTLEELKKSIKEKQENQNLDRSKSELEQLAVTKASENVKVDIPSGMVEFELDNIEQDMNQRFAYQGFSLDQYLQMMGKTKADFRKESEEQAIQNIKTRLVLEAICKAEKIEVSDEEVNNKVKELCASYGRKEEDLKNNETLLTHIKDSLKNEKAINVIIDNAKVTVKEVCEEHECEHTKKTTKKTSTKTADKTEKVEKETKSKKETK